MKPFSKGFFLDETFFQRVLCQNNRAVLNAMLISSMSFVHKYKKGIFVLVIALIIFIVFSKYKDSVLDVTDTQQTGDVTLAKVKRNIDGDTFVVTAADGEIKTIRLIGIDTPETKKPGTPVECGGMEASNNLIQLAPPRSKVKLVSDPTQESTDQYGRYLAYAYAEGNSMSLNEQQIQAGWADIYVFNNQEFNELDNFEKASAVAEQATAGIYQICKGNFHASEKQAKKK